MTEQQRFGARRITHVELIDWNGKPVTATITYADDDYYEARLEDGTLIATHGSGEWFVPNSPLKGDGSTDDLALVEVKTR